MKEVIIKLNSNKIILGYKIGYKLLFLFFSLFAIAFTIYAGEYIRNILIILIGMYIVTIVPFIHTMTSRVIIDKNEDFIVQHRFCWNKKAYYSDMAYGKITQEGNTVYLTVYSKEDKKLLKVNMIAYTNTEYLVDILSKKKLKIKEKR